MKYIITAIVILDFSGIFWYTFFYRREKKLVNRLLTMIRQAADGKLERSEISETKVSALENSLKRYLDDSLLAGENQSRQKSIIQGLISDISHQTLTPISNLKIYSELLKEQVPKELSDTADTINEETEKLDFLIQSLVKLSRMETGIITVHPECTSVWKLLVAIEKQYAKEADEKEIKFHVCDTKTQAKFDLKWTGEAVGNIVDNAIKYTNAGGEITIKVTPYTSFVRIDIADTGIGVSEEEIPKIFTRFYRSLSVSDLPGVGVGLYLSREIIQNQKGYIKVQSKVGKGSIFSVFLPK